MLLTSILLPCLTAQSAQDQGIPGLVEISKGKTYVGASIEEVKRLCAKYPGSAGSLSTEGPRRRITMDRYYMSSTEITNEQYFEFVMATGHPPPASWFKLTRELRDSIIREAKARDPEFVLTDGALGAWWAKNWSHYRSEWEMPTDRALEAVVFVSKQDAEAYCRWSGLRLPTEYEWVRAARGEDERVYPYGDKFDPTITSFLLTQPDSLARTQLAVNSFPMNASPFGCVDLSGGVWNWTSSPYVAFEGFNHFSITSADGRTVAVQPLFDGGRFVIRGGAYVLPELAMRIDTRAGLDSACHSSILGFRVACSPQIARDAMAFALSSIRPRILDGEPTRLFDLENTIGVENRIYANFEQARAIAARRGSPAETLPKSEPPESYAIFKGYECVAITSARKLDFRDGSRLARASRKQGPVPIGVLHTTRTLSDPNLPPGTYLLSYLSSPNRQEIVSKGASMPSPEREPAVTGTRTTNKSQEPGRHWPGLNGVLLEPDRVHVLIINNENLALAAFEIERPRLRTLKKSAHGVILNLERDRLEFCVAVEAPGKRAFNFVIPVRPLENGESLVKEDYWSAEFIRTVVSRSEQEQSRQY